MGAQQNRGGAPTAGWQFKLVKVNGQWRITNPPPFRMLNEHDFSQVYRPQDLYFFDWGALNRRYVLKLPDSRLSVNNRT